MTYPFDLDRRVTLLEGTIDPVAKQAASAHAQASANVKLIQAIRYDQLDMLSKQDVMSHQITTMRDEMDEGFAVVHREIRGLRQSQVDLQDGQDRLQQDVAELQTGQAELKHTVSELQTGQAELKHTVSELQNTVGGLKHTVSGLQKDVSELRHTMSEGFARILGLLEPASGDRRGQL